MANSNSLLNNKSNSNTNKVIIIAPTALYLNKTLPILNLFIKNKVTLIAKIILNSKTFLSL